MWPRRQDTVSRPARKPTALCPVDGLCFAWVPRDRAGHHSREEESFLPVRPWSAVDPFSKSTPVQVSNRSWVERSTLSRRPSPIPLRANDIDEQIEAVWPLSCGRRSWTPGSSSPKTWAQRWHPGARADGVLNQKERSQPTPVAVARCGNQHVGGGCCASS